MKKINLKKHFNWKLYLLVTIGLVIIALGATNAILRAYSIWEDTNDVIAQKMLDIKLSWPFRVEERKLKVVETITKEIIQVDHTNYVFVRVSHYWPPLGGTNCANYANGECNSKLANGKRWQEWVGLAIACPPEFEFGTKLKIGNRVWECMDRGSKIQTDGDLYWVDMLTYEALYDYGEIVKAEIIN